MKDIAVRQADDRNQPADSGWSDLSAAAAAASSEASAASESKVNTIRGHSAFRPFLVGREQKGQVQLCPEYDFTYDDLGRVTEIDNGATPDAPKVVLTMAYNSASRRTSLAAEIANTDDFLNTNQYDNVGRMTRSFSLLCDTSQPESG